MGITSMQDYVTPFTIDQDKVRGRLVRIGPLLKEITEKHQYPFLINKYIGELIVLGTALVMDIKSQGLITLQITKGSIISLLVVEITSQGDVRACAKWDNQKLLDLLSHTKEPSIAQLFEGGNLVFTLDLDHQKERYQAIVELNGATIAECMHHYFRQSEQIPSGLKIICDPLNESGYMAGALLLQRLPIKKEDLLDNDVEKEEDDWFTDLSLLATLTAKELFDENLSSEKLLYRLFHERDLKVFDKKPLQAKCKCSRTKIENALSQFSKEDLESMVVNGLIEVTCEFCNTSYSFSASEI